MLDLSTKVWTDQFGRQTHLSELLDSHLLNIRNFLRRLAANRSACVSQRQSYYESMACAYDAEYQDKDWYAPGSAFTDVEGAGEDDFNRLRVALMLISAEVHRRRLS